MTSLEDILEKYAVHIFKKSNQYTTVGAIKWKILQQCANCLNIDVTSCIDKSLICIHKENMNLLDREWQTLIYNNEKLSYRDINIYKLIKFSDYLNPVDVQMFLTILAKKGKHTFLNELLAVDGFKGFQIKNYIENLKYKNEKKHICIIRKIYRNMKVSVYMVHFALLHIYIKYDEKYIQAKLKKLEKEITYNECTLNNIIEYYKQNIPNLEGIAIIKINELKSSSERKKQVLIKKHILKEDHKERFSKKIKVSFITEPEKILN